ncbi:PREDICTED: mesoderm induction early response protein 1 isoform X2 [Acromyrmex echinatior]|uniref:mesoderm induction early response protein 1 isoform X1 n=3 Tax=Acromyrmex echinatior TaxID=103372 RepID=UPI0005810D3A|nr:PREDICTED: mesoderm induction early response protein 1 isoform X1 [Acromyrmex echinatior]XP_011068017.1 PREDICTED: mesoderm induction early response protein 1 isoform X2 [Acromyrmex echinatior]
MADRDYDMGSATEMMVNDFDDERTLDEEEALEGSEDSHNELSNLQKEGDMPLKDLLAMYGYGDPSTENSNSSDHMLLPSGSGNPETQERYSDKGDNDADDDDDDDEADATSNEPDLKQFYTEMLVKGKDKTAALAGSTTKGNSNIAGSRDNRKRRIDDDEDDDEDAEAEDCSGTRTGSRKKNRMSPTTGSANAVECSVIVNLGGASATNSTIEEGNASGPIDGSEDRIVSAGIGSGSSRLLRSVSRPQSEEEEDDCDYSPDEEEWKKTIMVGTDYQAAIPEGLCRYDDALPYENEDKMLWDPSHISEEDTEEFLERAQLPAVKGGSLPAGSHIRDDEQALYLLLQCGYNLEEALRRRRMNVLPPTDAVSLWSEEECHNFESGLRTYGKDFHLIQKNKVRTRSVGELVQFYYLWKKTERHDIFTYKARLEKKKYALHPGITRDYMDRFLEEQEGVRDRSSSPNVHCLLYGDTKRQRSSTSVTNNDESKSTDAWDGNVIDPLADVNGPTPAPPPPPPPPPPLITSAVTTISSICNSSALTTPTYCSPSTRHSDCPSSDSGCVNSLAWSGLASRSQPTSSVITTITINTTTATTSTAMVTSLGSTNTVTTSSTVPAATIAATVVPNNYYHQRVTSSRSNDSHDTPSPENILPHLPP